VYDVIRDSGTIDQNTRYTGPSLREPLKSEVLAWKPGTPFRREALAILMLGPRTVEAVVDVAGRRLVSWREIPGVHPDITREELSGQDAIAKASRRAGQGLAGDANALARVRAAPVRFPRAHPALDVPRP
jgi:primary-amine oxidase